MGTRNPLRVGEGEGGEKEKWHSTSVAPLPVELNSRTSASLFWLRDNLHLLPATKSGFFVPGEHIMKHGSDSFQLEVVINPRLETLAESIRVLLLSPTKHKHVIFAGELVALIHCKSPHKDPSDAGTD